MHLPRQRSKLNIHKININVLSNERHVHCTHLHIHIALARMSPWHTHTRTHTQRKWAENIVLNEKEKSRRFLLLLLSLLLFRRQKKGVANASAQKQQFETCPRGLTRSAAASTKSINTNLSEEETKPKNIWQYSNVHRATENLRTNNVNM